MRNREDRQRIQLLNAVLGMSHRDKPYDFAKDEDIIEATTMATAEYADMAHYSNIISQLDSDFDEALETYYPEEWFKQSLGEERSAPIADAVACISAADEALSVLADKAQENCVAMWQIVFQSAPPTVRAHFFGEKTFDEDILETLFSNHIWEVVNNMDYNGVIHHSIQSFCTQLVRA